jgi:peroxiredoxin
MIKEELSMSTHTDYNQLPPDLPVPVDDGAADHLVGMQIPPISLPSTAGGAVELSRLPGMTVIYVYPRTGSPQLGVPPGWDEVPGARGCTPQSCAFRDHHQELQSLGASVFGLSTQTTDYQREAAERLHLPFPLLSDVEFRLAHALHLPTFDFDGVTLLKRLTMVVANGEIIKVFYPVFPPNKNAEEVIAWLARHATQQ